MAALDYLQSREEVDPERIAVTGSSGGGNQAMYLAALDERVKVAVPVVSAEVFEDQVASGRCFCECIPGMMRFANVPDVLSLIAPRPLLIVSGVKDPGFTILRARKAYLRVREVYRRLGAEDRVAMVEVYAGHGYLGGMRAAMYRWLAKWLQGRDAEVVEEPLLEHERSAALDCFGGSFPASATLRTLYSRMAKRLRERRRSVSLSEWVERRDELRRAIVADVIGGFPEECPLRIEPWGAVEWGECASRSSRSEASLTWWCRPWSCAGAGGSCCTCRTGARGPSSQTLRSGRRSSRGGASWP